MSDIEDTSITESAQSDPCYTLSNGCNRLPFLSDEDCNRGDVDTHQFEDLPYCAPIDPTPPEIPPEVLPTPWVLPVPPPCSCVDVEYIVDFRGYTDKWDYEYKFRSKGDCCEGEYETDFEFELPCPIKKFGKKKFKARMRWNCDQDYEQSYIMDLMDSSGSSECGIDPKDIAFSLGLPCPINGDGPSTITIDLAWNGAKHQEAPYITAYNEADCEDEAEDQNCEITPISPTFNLGLDCPIKNQGEMTIGIGYGNKPSVDTRTYTNKPNPEEPDKCELLFNDPQFDLEIPCPVDADHLSITGSIQKGKDWDIDVLSETPADKDCARAFHIVITVPDGGGSSSSSADCYCAVVTVVYRHPLPGWPKLDDIEVCGPEGTVKTLAPPHGSGWVHVERLKNGLWKIHDYDEANFSACSITCEASSSGSSSSASSSSGSSSSASSSSGSSSSASSYSSSSEAPSSGPAESSPSGEGSSGSGSGGSGGSGGSSPEECVDVITGLKWKGTCLMYQTSQICGSFRITGGEGPWTSACPPTAGHVNKCCDDEKPTDGGTDGGDAQEGDGDK